MGPLTRIHARIRKLIKQGYRYADIEAEIGCSRYTIRRAINPDFIDRERERRRAAWPSVQKKRSKSDKFAAYQAAYSSTPEYREASRLRMQRIRAERG